MALSFRTFQRLNRVRCEQKFHPLYGDGAWTAQEWALAICGEAGELANLLKKVRRGDLSLVDAREDVLREVADVICYCDLLVSLLGADTGEEVKKKFNEVSLRVGYLVELDDTNELG